ncbi:MAG: hypothetical protein K9G46_14975 [Flavobacteriales bacterium]|nr:hypothetical protein [Flavobacteriales bacterium]
MLILIKSFHSLIWVVFVIFIGFILWGGITDNVNVYSWLAVIAIVFEGVVLLFFKGSCPLTKVARKYSDSSKANFDIYLPEWLARYNKRIFGSLFLLGVILLIIRLIS